MESTITEFESKLKVKEEENNDLRKNLETKLDQIKKVNNF